MNGSVQGADETLGADAGLGERWSVQTQWSDGPVSNAVSLKHQASKWKANPSYVQSQAKTGSIKSVQCINTTLNRALKIREFFKISTNL